MTETMAFPSRDSLRAWLFNPFHFIAGGRALAMGLAVLLLAGYNGSVSNSHFDGVLDFHTGAAAPLWLFLVEGGISWVSAALPLCLAGLLISKSRMRSIDVFGTAALARFPTLVMAFVALLPGYQRQIGRLTVMNLESIPADMAAFSFVALMVVAMLIWMVILMYNGFSVSCNARGWKAVTAFVVATLFGEIISKALIVVLAVWAMG
ncbi:MAG: hypothetical protein HZB26_25195 [Candidatus Hydrogenedentes bacterium]|nr:hypothetical protein [Candidatus Hydrogenedentota bacterium]